MTVNLIQFTHSYPDTADVMLVGPGGQRVLLMSDAGGDNAVANVILNFSDASAVFLPDSTRIVSGSYRPSNYEPTTGDPFPPPIPSGTLSSSLGVYNGTSPNGSWRLYAVSDSQSAGGSIAGGWQLSITTANPPAIIKQPEDEVVSPGGTARFIVDVSGTPPFQYQWLRNGKVIVPFGQGSSILTIQNVGPQHAGLYSVIIINAVDQAGVQSREASLFVRGPLQIPPPGDAIVLPDTNVTFYATPTGDPPFRYQWRRNGIWLAGETNSTLQRLRVQATDGGHYSVIVQNGDGARTSGPGLLKVLAADGPSPTDDFRNRPLLETDHGILQGDSEKASSEAGEPLLLGGGNTMWFEWKPRQSGIVRFTALGSSFDTMLAIYPQNANGGIDTSRVITTDDDRAGFYTSQLDFNAQAGQSYFVQLDGFGIGGDGGEFTLKWDLVSPNLRTPVIQTNPVPQSVKLGERATFSATVEQIAGVPLPAFQWLFNGSPIPNQTGPTLILQNVQKANVGFYSLRLRNEFGITTFSPPVSLQTGFPPGSFMQDKPQMMFLMSGGQFVPIGVGFSVFKQAPWPAQAKEKDPTPCDSPFAGTLWQGITATNTGRIQVTTSGSTILTRLGVYLLTGAPEEILGTNDPIVCDITSGSNGLPCTATFDGIAGTNYTIVVEGITAPTGVVQVTSIMGVAPTPTNILKYCLVFEHGSMQLTNPATGWFPVPEYQWFYNDSPIPDATNAVLNVTDFGLSDIGTYSVRMSNFVRTVTRNVAFLDIAPLFELHYSWVSGAGGTGYKITASNAAPFVLETTTDLAGAWTPVATNPDPCLVLYYTNGPPVIGPQRFYRAVPWSPGP